MSSDSSEDENLDHLQEAVDSQFFNESMFKENPSDTVINNIKTFKEELPPSLRIQDEDEQFNSFKVTPKFQNYIAKHLSKALEGKLKKLLRPAKAFKSSKTKKLKSGVRLLRDSKKFLKVENYDGRSSALNKHNLAAKLKKHIEEVDEEVIKSLAITPEEILNKTETKHWSNRSKAPVYFYKKSRNGTLTLIEPKFQ